MTAFNSLEIDIEMDPSSMMSSLKSGAVGPMISSMVECATYASMKGRQDLAVAAMDVVYQFAYSRSKLVRARLVEVPGLLSSLSNLCGEEALLKKSKELVDGICSSATSLSKGSPERAAALVEAGWAELLIRAIRIRYRDQESVDLASLAIYTLLSLSPADGKAAFIAAGAEGPLVVAMERYRKNRDVVRFCSKSLGILRA